MNQKQLRMWLPTSLLKRLEAVMPSHFRGCRKNTMRVTVALVEFIDAKKEHKSLKIGVRPEIRDKLDAIAAAMRWTLAETADALADEFAAQHGIEFPNIQAPDRRRKPHRLQNPKVPKPEPKQKHKASAA